MCQCHDTCVHLFCTRHGRIWIDIFSIWLVLASNHKLFANSVSIFYNKIKNNHLNIFLASSLIPPSQIQCHKYEYWYTWRQMYTCLALCRNTVCHFSNKLDSTLGLKPRNWHCSIPCDFFHQNTLTAGPIFRIFTACICVCGCVNVHMCWRQLRVLK